MRKNKKRKNDFIVKRSFIEALDSLCDLYGMILQVKPNGTIYIEPIKVKKLTGKSTK